MKQIFAVVLICVCFTVILSPVAVAGTEAEDERASAFVADTGEHSEQFDRVKGLVLLVMANLAVLACFALIMYSINTNNRYKADLEAIDAALRMKDGPHA